MGFWEKHSGYCYFLGLNAVWFLPCKALFPSVLVPQIATANSFTNKKSQVLFLILAQASLHRNFLTIIEKHKF